MTTSAPRALLLWLRLIAVAVGYVLAFVVARRWLSVSVTSPAFVVIAMVCALGLAAVAAPVIPIRMPAALRPVRPWEGRRGPYAWLGVPAFGRMLRRTPLRLLNTHVYVETTGRENSGLEVRLESAEASHVWVALLVVPYMAYLVARAEWLALFWVTAAQVAWNLYPVMHLRQARFRVGRLTRRARGRARDGGPA